MILNQHLLNHLKKKILDSNEIKNYRPISNLSFLSKLIECVIANRLQSHISSTDHIANVIPLKLLYFAFKMIF